MSAPFTLMLDIEVWADREEELNALFDELHAEEIEEENEGAR